MCEVPPLKEKHEENKAAEKVDVLLHFSEDEHQSKSNLDLSVDIL